MSLSFIDVILLKKKFHSWQKKRKKEISLMFLKLIHYTLYFDSSIMDSNVGFEYDIAFMCSKKCYQNKFSCHTSRSIIKWDVTFKVDW